MPDNKCTPFLENIPAYALGALDTDEIAALEAHLRTCDACPQELAAYRAVSDSLLMALPPRQPASALRERLRARTQKTETRTPRRHWSFNRFALAAVAILLVALNIFSALQIQALRREQELAARQAESAQTAMAMLAYPETKTFPINAPGIAGTLLLDREHNAAVLIVWDLPPLPADQTYQAWLIDPGGDRTSAGLFRPEPGQTLTTQVMMVKQDLSKFIGLGVTIEPAGGADQATGPRVFRVDF